MSTDIQGLLKSLGEQLERLGVEHGIADNAAVVVLPGKKKLKTVVGLIPAPDSLRVEAFVCRAVEENHEAVYKWLLQRNRRLFGIGYTIDADDDLDRLLGQLLETADGDFNQILERGFASAIKREWEWRVDRGENLANLEQFRHMVE